MGKYKIRSFYALYITYNIFQSRPVIPLYYNIVKYYEIYHLKTAFFVKIKCESNINSSKISDFNYFLYSRYKKAL
jgi:hypothetical protein